LFLITQKSHQQLFFFPRFTLKKCSKEEKKKQLNKLISHLIFFHFSLAFTSTTDQRRKTLSQIAEEGFLEFINNILTIGTVPALFTDDEKDTIIGNCRNAAKEAGYSVSK
jgi:hypothetical protein